MISPCASGLAPLDGVFADTNAPRDRRHLAKPIFVRLEHEMNNNYNPPRSPSPPPQYPYCTSWGLVQAWPSVWPLDVTRESTFFETQSTTHSQTGGRSRPSVSAVTTSHLSSSCLMRARSCCRQVTLSRPLSFRTHSAPVFFQHALPSGEAGWGPCPR